MNEFLGRAALMVVTDKKTLQKVLTGILIVFIALFTPVIAAVEVLNSDFTIDADELETMLMSHLDESEKAQLQEMDSQIRKLDNKMSSAGYGARTKEAEVLWMLALYGKPTDSKTADGFRYVNGTVKAECLSRYRAGTTSVLRYGNRRGNLLQRKVRHLPDHAGGITAHLLHGITDYSAVVS